MIQARKHRKSIKNPPNHVHLKSRHDTSHRRFELLPPSTTTNVLLTFLTRQTNPESDTDNRMDASKYFRKQNKNHTETNESLQDFAEFKKLLRYFNKELGPSVCVFTIINVSWVVSGTFWILKFDHVDHQNLQFLGITVLNLLLWATIAAAPFVQVKLSPQNKTFM